MSGVCYISGKMTGIPEPVWQRNFAEGADYARSIGFAALNPADIPPGSMHTADGCTPDKHAWRCWMRKDLEEMVKRCTAILMLPGWEDSPGARAELAVAEMLGFTVIFMPPADARARVRWQAGRGDLWRA